MAIYKKADIEKRLEGLERYYLGLREALQGRPPGAAWAPIHRISEERLAEAYTSVDFDEVLLRLDHFKAEVTAVKALKAHAVKPPKVYG